MIHVKNYISDHYAAYLDSDMNQADLKKFHRNRNLINRKLIRKQAYKPAEEYSGFSHPPVV